MLADLVSPLGFLGIALVISGTGIGVRFMQTRGRTMPETTETEIPVDKAPPKLDYEIFLPKEDGDVVIKKGKISKKQSLLFWKGFKPHPRGYFLNHVTMKEGNETKVRHKFWILHWTSKKVVKPIFKVRWNVFWAEAISKTTESVPKFSQELSNFLLGDDMIQHRNGVARIQAFILDAQMLRLFAFIFLIGIPFGIFMDTILNLIPTQIVHWLP